ncbi:MAG: PQQ-binding-like beta-propeller repeat protein, partial [Terriglobia bacterium]
WILGLLSFVLTARADGQWTRFRGPNGSGVDSAAGYPAEFSASKNVIWKASVPYGQSSPILFGSRLFLTASAGDRLLTICWDANTGRELWEREIRRERTAKTFKANDPASPTPAADESGVFVFFPDVGLVSYTLEGKERWRYPLGPFHNFYGMASSPVVAGDLVVLVCDQQTGSFLIAVDRATGRMRWKTERAGMTIGWATPMIFRPGQGSAELVVLGTTRLDSYSLATGEQRWWKPLASMGSQGTPVVHGDTILVATQGSNEPYLPAFGTVLAKYDKDSDGRLSWQEFQGDPDLGEHFGWLDTNGDKLIDEQEWNAARALGTGEYGAIALRPDKAEGPLEAGAVRWRFLKNLPYIPAPLVYQNVYYILRSGGIITSLNPETGELLKEGRSREALGDYYASPVAADGKVFLVSEEGKVTVLNAGPQWEVLAVNDLGEEVHATPALSNGRIYVRTRSSLYCFGTSR